jgi:hypothetical protein
VLEASVFKNLNFQHGNLWVAYLSKPTFFEKVDSIDKIWESVADIQSKIFQSVSWVKSVTDVGILPFLTRNVEIPFPSITTERQHGVWFPTDESVPSSFSMTFYETSDWMITSLIRKWMSGYYDFNSRCFDFSKIIGTTSFKSYCLVAFMGISKFNLMQFGPSVEKSLVSQAPVKIFSLDGIFPTEIANLNLDYGTGEPLQVQVTFSIDRVLDETNDPTLAGIGTLSQSAEYVSNLVSAFV